MYQIKRYIIIETNINSIAVIFDRLFLEMILCRSILKTLRLEVCM